MHHPTDRTAHTTAFVISVVDHWLQREIAPENKIDYHKTVVNIRLANDGYIYQYTFTHVDQYEHINVHKTCDPPVIPFEFHLFV